MFQVSFHSVKDTETHER